MSENLQKILEIFYQICEIPHPSGQTSELKAFLIDFLRACGCEVKTDSAGNIHALKGTPNVVFQAHYDMVLVGEEVAPYIQGDLLKSRNSSLGADNGIAVALLLHFAKTRKNIEILLTNDEEIGMLGAKNLTLQTRSKMMINLDSECINEICVGCAGGFDVDIDLRLLDNLPLGFGNSVLGMQFRTCGNFWTSTDSSLVESPKISTNTKATPQSLPLRFCESQNLGENQAQFAESSEKIKSKKPIKSFCSVWLIPKVESPLPLNPNLPNNADSAESQNLNQNNSVRSTQTRPLRGAKNRKEGCSSATADFLLEADKRGSPPKSEKAVAFWRVGGAGRGVQPFLRKRKNSEENAESIRDSSPTAQNDKIMKLAESALDSANQAKIAESTQESQGGLPRSHSLARNDDSFLDSAFYEFSAHNFKGGHSGIDIDKNIKNAIVELLFALDSARKMGEFEILEISGGEARNSIPINARAVIATKSPIDFTQQADSAPHIAIKKLANYTPKQKALKSAVVAHLLRLHNGIYEVQNGSVTSSLNFSQISQKELKIMVRGNRAEFLERQILRLKYLFGEAVEISGFYNAWEANSSCSAILGFDKNAESSAESTLFQAVSQIYQKHKIPFNAVQIHAGLECGILKEKCGLDEVVSIGPTILYPHSKNECLNLPSVGQIYEILADLVE